jgi:hypothetical protein
MGDPKIFEAPVGRVGEELAAAIILLEPSTSVDLLFSLPSSFLSLSAIQNPIDIVWNLSDGIFVTV